MDHDSPGRAVPDEVHEYATSLVEQGKTREAIVENLTTLGLSPEAAEDVATGVAGPAGRSDALQPDGGGSDRLLLFGGLWFAGGIVVTVLTHLFPIPVAGSGVSVTAGGAIVFGIILFLWGIGTMERR